MLNLVYPVTILSLFERANIVEKYLLLLRIYEFCPTYNTDISRGIKALCDSALKSLTRSLQVIIEAQQSHRSDTSARIQLRIKNLQWPVDRPRSEAEAD